MNTTQIGSIILTVIYPQNDTIFLTSHWKGRRSAFDIQPQGTALEHLFKQVHPDDLERSKALYLSLKSGKIRKIRDELRYTRPSGETLYFEFHYVGTNFGNTGKPQKIEGYFQNITKQKRKEQFLLNQNEFVDKVLDLIPVPIHIKDEFGKYIYWNKESVKLFGNHQNATIFEVLGQEQGERISEIDRQIYDTGIPYVANEAIRTLDGRHLETSVCKNIVSHNDLKYLLVTRWDISEKSELSRKSRILSTSMQALNAYTWYCDLRDNILTFGEGFEHSGGNSEQMNSLTKFAQKIHPQHRQYFLDFMDNFSKQDNGDFAIEYMIDYTNSENYQWWECRGVIESTSQNGIPYKYLYGIDINITSRKQGELSLLETQSKLAQLNKQTELILNNTNSGLVFLDNDYVVQWENLSGYLPHPTLSCYKKGAICHQVLKGLNTPCPGCVVERSRQSLQREFKEVTFGELQGELTATPVFSQENELIGTVLKVVNITDKQKMALELNAAKEKAEETHLLMQNIYDRIPCMLFIKDISDNFRYIVANNYFCTSLGKPSSQVVGYTDFEIFPPEEAQKFRTDDLLACELDKPFLFEEETLWQGKPITWQTTKTVVRAINNHKILICLSVDLSEKMTAYKELEEAKEKAEQSNKLKSAFLANMSHEIRTPLNAIVGFSNLMAFSETEEDKKEYYNIININNELLLRLIGDILDLSKIEAGMLELKPERFNLGELFDGLHLTFSQRITSPNVQLICNIPEHDSRILYLDKNRFTQVISNFLTNAIKFTPSGKIEIGYTYVNEGVKVYVADTGIGIEESKISKVFERFEKLDDFAQGTGLGMAICKAILDAFGGQIGVESEEGKGSTFWAWFPIENIP